MKNPLEVVCGRLQRLGISLNKELGQHFLVDEKAITALAGEVSPGGLVIEVGAGVGQLTEALAQKAEKVISIEMDRRFKPVLEEIGKANPKVQFIFDNVIRVDLRGLITGSLRKERGKSSGRQEVQIVANLPFHLSEPFLKRVIELPVKNVTLVVGDRLAFSINAHDEESPDFGTLTLLARTYYVVNTLTKIPKENFFPVPRTDAVIIQLIPKKPGEIRGNKRSFLFYRLFSTAKNSPLVKNVLKEALIEFEHVRITQNQSRSLIAEMGIADKILEKPFEQLNNGQLRQLSKVFGGSIGR